MQFTAEYFIDQKRYFSLILLHINAAFCVGLFSLIATGAMLISYLQFTCGMFRISRYKTNTNNHKNSNYYVKRISILL